MINQSFSNVRGRNSHSTGQNSYDHTGAITHRPDRNECNALKAPESKESKALKSAETERNERLKKMAGQLTD
ncbi:MAG: hypothetical protein EBT51_12115 [Flavobacteriaceae bacterium]|nr:hypothetical protein [Flavobacteriaceae bacterium]